MNAANAVRLLSIKESFFVLIRQFRFNDKCTVSFRNKIHVNVKGESIKTSLQFLYPL
jgi:hypothetical protein